MKSHFTPNSLPFSIYLYDTRFDYKMLIRLVLSSAPAIPCTKLIHWSENQNIWALALRPPLYSLCVLCSVDIGAITSSNIAWKYSRLWKLNRTDMKKIFSRPLTRCVGVGFVVHITLRLYFQSVEHHIRMVSKFI